MHVVVERAGDVAFVIESRGHRLISDQPRSSGGTDNGMTPPELLLASLGTCVGYYVTRYCGARNLDCGNLRLTIAGEIGHHPGRIGAITIDVEMPPDLGPEQLDAVMRVAKHCTIHNTLTHPPEIEIRIHAPARMGAKP
jgi:uncharacterized OsmC-like protein